VGDEVYRALASAIDSGTPLYQAAQELGVSTKVAGEIAAHLLGGASGYSQWAETGRLRRTHENREAARKSSGLEKLFVSQLGERGFVPCGRNSWCTIEVGGERVRREVDLKFQVDAFRKVAVFCDGIVFHGPGCLYHDPLEKIKDDRETALAFYSRGYSSLRYSGTEIRSGWAISHFIGVVESLAVHEARYRNWCPEEELFKGKGKR